MSSRPPESTSSHGKGSSRNWMKDVKPDDPVFEDAQIDDLIIVIAGLTGAGKSTCINRYCGSEIMEVNHGLESCTRHISVTTIQLPEDHQVLPNRRLVLVDTPGFNDTDQAEYETFRRISTWLAQSYEKGTKITGLVYLHAIVQTRITASGLLSYDVFHSICGQNAVSRVVMATSHWDTIALPIGEYRENELKTRWWKNIIDQGAHYQRIEEPLRDIVGIVEHLLGKHAVSTQIQEELVDMDKRIAETEAGKKLASHLEKMLGSSNTDHLSEEKEEELKRSGFPLDGALLDRVKSLFRRKKGRNPPRHSAHQDFVPPPNN